MSISRPIVLLVAGIIAAGFSPLTLGQDSAKPPLAADELSAVRAAEEARGRVIDQVIASVVAIYDDDYTGGGSGVIIDPSGLALTNHHVIMGAGTSGWGGLSDGVLYRWRIIGVDPGGDLALIRLEGRDDFCAAPLGDSDTVAPGDWVMAMGNPFLLADDHVPTVTLGIVSGVNRYQGGEGNELVYGDCIQVDSSINPGNSGGPLFNMRGEVIGINGRGSFRDRGRVNVGLGYAISSNQIRRFLPDLMATKLAQHGSLDATFSDRDGHVVCSTINPDAPAAEAGLELGDRLIEFEGQPIATANQLTNLVCTLPVDWPARLRVEKLNGQQLTLRTRLVGLPYGQPPLPPQPQGDPSPEQQKQWKRARQMAELLRAEPNVIRDADLNAELTAWLIQRCRGRPADQPAWPGTEMLCISEVMMRPAAEPLSIDEWFATAGRTQPAEDFVVAGAAQTWLAADGRFRVHLTRDGQSTVIGRSVIDGEPRFWRWEQGQLEWLSPTKAKLDPLFVAALGLAASVEPASLDVLGTTTLDGSDKLDASTTAFRCKVTDEGGDWFYFWLAEDQDDPRRLELVKASSDLDADHYGGVVFCGGINARPDRELPVERAFVEDTDRIVGLWRATQSERQPIDESLFAPPAADVIAAGVPAVTGMEQHWPDAAPTIEPRPSAGDDGLFGEIIRQAQRRLVKVYGARVGRVDGYATGIIVSATGDILTVQGVYLDAQQVRVTMSDGSVHTARVVRRDRNLQLALLNVDIPTPDYFALSDADVGYVGDWIVAVGNAFKVADGPEPLAPTRGVISLRTSLTARASPRDLAYDGPLVLIDAITSNPGAGGGAVIDADGQLVGMIGKTITSSQTNTRLNYAVPAAELKAFLEGRSDEPSPAMASAAEGAELGIRLFTLGGNNGAAYIDRVLPGGPADQTGLRPDDLVVSLAGEIVSTIRQYDAVLATIKPGDEIVIVVKRGEELVRVTLIAAVK